MPPHNDDSGSHATTPKVQLNSESFRQDEFKEDKLPYLKYVSTRRMPKNLLVSSDRDDAVATA
nr:palindromic element RPE3 domain-containing protein [Rickettsia endosymbiont of Ceutorhynchus assimilis]